MLTRQFIHRSAAGLALPAIWQGTPPSDTFRIGVIADSHVIDPGRWFMPIAASSAAASARSS